jgi:hypothetical protein
VELTSAELSYVRSQGLHLTEKCDHCGEVLNQTFHYRLNDRDPRKWCSAACQDADMGWEGRRYQARINHELRCQRDACGSRFESRRADAKYCSPRCRKWASRSSQGRAA